MKTILVNYKDIEPRFDELSICLGYFDGVHLGHQELIKYARKNAKHTLGLITFDRPISTLIDNGKNKTVLTSLDDRFKIISKLGVDFFFIFKIDKDFVNLSEMEFVNVLKKMNVKEIFVGKDFRYGKNHEGTIYTLQDYFDVKVIDLVSNKEEKIATQNIASLLLEGNLESASKLLGRNYTISGTIEEGNKIGRTIGFPTINLKLNADYLLPRFGVYKVICFLDNKPYRGIANVGVKPTITNKGAPNVEIHLFSFNNCEKCDLISVEFIKFIRDERKFSSLDELKKQIQKDCKEAF